MMFGVHRRSSWSNIFVVATHPGNTTGRFACEGVGYEMCKGFGYEHLEATRIFVRFAFRFFRGKDA